MRILLLDSSGSWDYIAAVLVSRIPPFSCFHVASLDKERRSKIIRDALNFILSSGYGICVHAFVPRKVRTLAHGNRKSRKRLWRGVIRHELGRIANHLKNLRLWPIDIIYADREFEQYRDIIENIFETDNVSIEKSNKLCLADIIAYLNLKNPKIIRKISNIKEIK